MTKAKKRDRAKEFQDFLKQQAARKAEIATALRELIFRLKLTPDELQETGGYIIDASNYGDTVDEDVEEMFSIRVKCSKGCGKPVSVTLTEQVRLQGDYSGVHHTACFDGSCEDVELDRNFQASVETAECVRCGDEVSLAGPKRRERDAVICAECIAASDGKYFCGDPECGGSGDHTGCDADYVM
jgi:hypothetical protein